MDTSQYNTENTEQDELGIIARFYYIEIYDDDTFLLVTTTFYYDGSLISVGDCGIMVEVIPNVYELVFEDPDLVSLYILFNEDGIYFCDEEGNIFNGNEGNTGNGILDGSNIDSDEFDYGYYNLVSNLDYEDMRVLYEDLYDVNLDFSLGTEDFIATEGQYVLMDFDYLSYDLTLDDALETIKIFKLDHPEFYWVSNEITISGTTMYVYVIDVYASYAYRAQVDEAIQSMIDDLDQLIVEGMSDLVKAKVIHDFIITRVDYSYEVDGTTPESEYWAHNLEGIALQTGAVCEAYAETFDFLLEHYGIKSILVTGQSGDQNHIWNLVSIDGAFYFFDSTWDDAGGESISYTYFGTSYAFLTDTHQIESSSGSGLSYLYDLPYVSEEDIAIVSLYEK